MVEFGGWLMPLQYSSIREEHNAVRQRAGLFDVSHMGEFVLSGDDATDQVQRVVSNDVADLLPGQARYTVLCNRDGGIIDDALVYRDQEGFMVVVNAATRDRDLQHFRAICGQNAVVDRSLETGLLALQGPKALAILQPFTTADLRALPYYHSVDDQLVGVPARISRTGYTGEDGFELFLPWAATERVFNALLEDGRGDGLLPCGLGARDTLRLEAGMRLYGSDMSERDSPYEAGLGWTVKLEKGDFCGRDALRRMKEAGTARAFIGLTLDGRAIARHGYPILDDADRVGEVTSGTFSFTLQRAIATGYVRAQSRESSLLTVDVRGTPVAARRVPLPFYKREQA
jgi:aminomethyltransferase